MGRREKIDERMRVSAEGQLAHDETMIGMLSVVRFVPIWPLALGLFGVNFALIMYGIDLPAWATGAAIGATIGAFMRAFFWIQTDQRVILIRPAYLSTKKSRFDSALPLSSIQSASIKDGMFSDRLQVTTSDGKSLRFIVGRQWEEDAKNLVRSLNQRGLFRSEGSGASDLSSG